MFRLTKPLSWIEGVFNVSVITSIALLLIYLVRPDKIKSDIPFLSQHTYILPLIIILFTIIAAVFVVIKRSIENKILMEDFGVTATVVSIDRNVFFKVPAIKKGSIISPYIIRYKYKYSNREYILRSQYIWKVPKFSVNNSINILIDKDKPFRSMIKI